jgi:hypothetical protein
MSQLRILMLEATSRSMLLSIGQFDFCIHNSQNRHSQNTALISTEMKLNADVMMLRQMEVSDRKPRDYDPMSCLSASQSAEASANG